MILGQIAWVDCAAFLIFLAPQLIVQIGLLRTIIVGIKALPFLGGYQPISIDPSGDV